MSWQIDGRNGVAKVGESQREGFALMRDQDRQLIAFHIRPNDTYAPGGSDASPHQFVISEGDFEPTAA